MMSIRTVSPELREAIAQSAAKAARLGRPVLLTALAEANRFAGDPLHFLRAFAGQRRCYWSTPGRGFAFAGVGEAATVRVSGPRRFQQAAEAWRRLTKGRSTLADGVERPPSPFDGPVAFSGFSFFEDRRQDAPDPWREFPDGLLVVPSLALFATRDKAWLSHTVLVRPELDPDTVLAEMHALMDADLSPPRRTRSTLAPTLDLWRPDPHAWREKVIQAARLIRDGQLSKVVLAHAFAARRTDGFCPVNVLEALEQAHPDAYVFGALFGDDAFVGASPEQLAALEGSVFRGMALAGSASRGGSAAEDRRLETALLNDAKNRIEHRIVVDYVKQALAPLCDRVDAAPEPKVMKLSNVQHLHTPVEARLAAPTSVFQVLERLHPTPAVGGYPKDAAMALIRALEAFERGWYAGPIGWVGGEGDGEFAVGIRSALLTPKGASIFAGCGIVADSSPEEELQESYIKARPMLEALERSLA